MDPLFSRTRSRQELLEHVGHMGQVAGVKLLQAGDGLARGSRLLQVWTGSGLSFDVLPDRALDISACRYKGIPLAWISPVGEADPGYYEPEGVGWLRYFPGGLLVTCGLDQFGYPSEDEGEAFGLHWMRFQPPTPGCREQVFHHTPIADADGRVRAWLENAALGLGLRWTYDRASLPHLFQWKMMGQGLYVLGVEPANSGVMQGRAAARRGGDLPNLAPGEIRGYTLDVEVVEGTQ